MMNLTVTRLFHRLIRAIVSGRRANAWNIGFKNSLRWLIYIMSVDKRKLSTSFRRRSTVGNLPPLFYWGSWLKNRETRISQVRFRFGWLRAFLERKKTSTMTRRRYSKEEEVYSNSVTRLIDDSSLVTVHGSCIKMWHEEALTAKFVCSSNQNLFHSFKFSPSSCSIP